MLPGLLLKRVVVGIEILAYCGSCLLHKLRQVLFSQALSGDGVANGQCNVSRAKHYGLLRQNLEGSVTSDWENRDARLNGHHECTLLERLKIPIRGPGPFRVN